MQSHLLNLYEIRNTGDLPIAYRLEDIQDFLYDHFYKDIYAGESYGQWAQPDVASIRNGMRQIYDYPGAWREKARRASAIIREKFDWSEAARRAVAFLIDSSSANP